jgi:hypothetical protein
MMKKTILTISVTTLLMACDGPWNMSVSDHVADRSLWLSAVQTADRPFDTVWIEQTNPLTSTYDEMSAVAGAGSWLRIYQDSAGVRDTVNFAISAGQPHAWVPVATDAAKRVRRAATLALSAHIVRTDGSLQDLSSSSYTQPFYALSDSFAVPVEALHPSLANGTFRLALQANQSNTAAVLKLIRDLDTTGKFFETWHLKPEDLYAFAAGQSVMRNVYVKGNDTLWYVSDESFVLSMGFPGQTSGPQPATFRQWVLRQKVDRASYGGTVFIQGFDPSRARIFGQIFRQFGKTFGNVDSSGLFQRGDTRSWLSAPKVGGSSLPAWPDSILLSNSYLGYTGRNRLYGWAVDSLYYEHYKALTGETGDGQYEYSNIKGGKGYFTGAILDSATFDLEAAFPDTVQVTRLRTIWCDSVRVRKARGEASAIPNTQVKQFCSE